MNSFYRVGALTLRSNAYAPRGFFHKPRSASPGLPDRRTLGVPQVAVLSPSAGADALPGSGAEPSTYMLSIITSESPAERAPPRLSGPIKSFPTSRSVPADVNLVDSDSDGWIDRGYAVDLAGKIYRIDFETPGSTAPADWSIYTLADLSGGTTTGRKFFFGPDAVVTKVFTALLFGSGDREKPLLSATADHFFQIIDRNTGKGPPTSYSAVTFSSLVPAGAESNVASPGRYVALDQGEKVVNAATSIAGTSFFGTNRPSPPVGERLLFQPRHRQDLRHAAILRLAHGQRARRRWPPAEPGVGRRHHRQRRIGAPRRLRHRSPRTRRSRPSRARA